VESSSLLGLPEVRAVVEHAQRQFAVELAVVDGADDTVPAEGGLPLGRGFRLVARGGPAGDARLAELMAVVAHELAPHYAGARDEVRTPPRSRYEMLVGAAPLMQALYRTLERVAATDATVLISGENGTGKELIAKALHARSGRAERRFVVQNCAAFTDGLLDSELFGHKRGAFTGAIADKRGLFELADGGTFFLDEIGDTSPAMQVKLLRVLQEGTFTPVGGSETRTTDVRVIAATNRNLPELVRSGAFREDLFYRLNVIAVTAPPLRTRTQDLRLLVDTFLRKHSRGRGRLKKLAPGCWALLEAYPWPGNVRELENEIERMMVLSGPEQVISQSLLSPRIAGVAGLTADAPRTLPAQVEALERDAIGAALERHRGNKTRVAEELGISRRNLIRLVARYGLEQAGRRR
jgi:transcriptional regulator with PAS, ATPase and Fis domain